MRTIEKIENIYMEDNKLKNMPWNMNMEQEQVII